MNTKNLVAQLEEDGITFTYLGLSGWKAVQFMYKKEMGRGLPKELRPEDGESAEFLNWLEHKKPKEFNSFEEALA